MHPNANQFPNLRLSNLRLASLTKGTASSDISSNDATPLFEATTPSKPSKSVIIENNRLTIGGVDGTKRSFGSRLHMDTSGLKIKGRVDQEELENAIRTPISRTLHFSKNRNRSYQLELGFHNSSSVEDFDVLTDLNQFPGAQEGDLAELRTYHHSPTSKDKKIYFKIKNFDPEMRRRTQNSHISISTGHLQQLLDLPARSTVWVKLKSKYEYQADLVELHVKDCYVTRGDMWCFSSKLVDSCVFLGQRITFVNSLRTVVKGIYRNGKKVVSGYIGSNSKVIYRSESARLVFLIQITEEMWHFEPNGEKTFHKVVNSLFPKIFKKWKEVGTHHNITIVFCASVHEGNESFRNLPPGVRLNNTKDYFRVVVDQVNILYWSEIMKTLRREFMRIKSDLLSSSTEDGNSVIKGEFTPVIKSNILETINFATTLLTDPFKQPELRHTTTHIIIISPGSGLYDVASDLLKATCKKLLSLEVVVDLICLSRAPLHVAPLFRFIDSQGNLQHAAPKWLSISFWNSSPRSASEWLPRCKIYDIQMMGNNDGLNQELSLEYMNSALEANSITSFMRSYDREVFNMGKDTSHDKSSDTLYSLHKRSIDLKPSVRKPIAEVHSIMWNPQKSSKPLVEPTNIQSVVSLHQPGNNSNVSEDELTDTSSSLSSPEGTESLALASLKNMTHGTQGLTKRIVSRFISDIKTKRRRYSTSMSNENTVRNYNIDAEAELKKPETQPSLHPPFMKCSFRSFDRDGIANSKIEGQLSSKPTSAGSPKRGAILDKNINIFDEGSKRKQNTRDSLIDETLVDSLIQIENPSTSMDNQLVKSLIPERWRDVYPRYVAKKYSKWRSFTTPAELPVTTAHFPSLSDFQSNFIFRNHSVSLSIDREKYGLTAFDLLRDMIYTRLLAGFQICTSEIIRKVEASHTNDVNSPELAKTLSRDNYMSSIYYMVIDTEIHRISCDCNGTIDVQRFLRTNEKKVLDSVPHYKPLIKTRYEVSYRESQLDPVSSMRSSLRWNQVDQLLAGYDDFPHDIQRVRFRSKFVILPSYVPPNTFSSTINGRKETLSPEEIRLEGLRKLISSISKSRLYTHAERDFNLSRKEEILPEIHFYTGSLFDFIHEHVECLLHLEGTERSSINSSEGRFAKDITYTKLAYEMQHGEKPLKMINRRWHFKHHSTCFVGLEMVNWLIENFSDIDTRDDAVLYGQKLLSEKVFHHVESRHGFLDGHYFYQLYPEYKDPSVTPNSPNEQTNIFDMEGGRRKSSTSNTSTKQSTSTATSSSKDHNFPILQSPASALEPSVPTVLISTAVEVDLDLACTSDKLESCIVHYDRVHNPDHCFHIRVEWLTATPKLVDTLVTNWSRLCERYGLRLVEVPWHELCDIPKLNPLHSFVEIKLSVNPWTDSEFKDIDLFEEQHYYYHVFLLETFGFLLDNRASKILNKEKVPYNIIYSWGKPSFKYAQFIHNTGTYMAEIRENGDLFLAPNNAYMSRINIGSVVGNIHASSKFVTESQRVMLGFKETCESHDKLLEIFREAKAKRAMSLIS